MVRRGVRRHVSVDHRDAPSAATTFGLSERLPRPAAEQLHAVLVNLWDACHHRPPAGMRADLELHRRFFDPVAQGKRLREALLTIDAIALPGPLDDAQAITV